MSKWHSDVEVELGWKLAACAALVCAAALAGPARAGDIYSWTAEDGGLAYTDDAKSIPARYRDAAEVRASQDLSGYRHLTPTDAAASERYAERLAERVERLRALNDQLARAPRPPGASAAAAASDASVTVRTGDLHGPGVNVSAGETGEPIVVQNVVVRPDGGAVTQNAQVVRRGGRVVSVVMGTPNEWDIGSVVEASELLDSAE